MKHCLSKKEQALEKIVDEIKKSSTIKGIVILKNLIKDITTYKDSKKCPGKNYHMKCNLWPYLSQGCQGCTFFDFNYIKNKPRQ